MRTRKIAAAVLFFLSLAAVVLCAFPALFPWEERVSRLLRETLPRLFVAAFLIVLLWGSFRPHGRFLRALLWSMPCIAVALVNFPYSALLSGTARIERFDLLWLFLLKCLSVALMEELFFRALLLPFLRERLRGRRGEFYLSVILSAAIFALAHLLNLLAGAGFGATMLQVGYTFLLGMMFGVMYCVTENIWLCVGVHFLFDVGGLIVTDLGSGAFQDTVFWALTVVVGVICAVYVAISAYFFQKGERAKNAEK